MTRRIATWEQELPVFAGGYEGRAFAWGEWDCCLAAAAWIERATGLDVAAPFRGRYRTRLGAARVLQAFAGGGVAALAEKIAAQFGFEEVPPLFAQRGDVVLVDGILQPDTTEEDPQTSAEDATPDPYGPALGVVSADGWHFLVPGPGGVLRVPLAKARRAWRIA